MKYKITSKTHSYSLIVDSSASYDTTYYLISNIFVHGLFLDRIIVGYADVSEINMNANRFINFTRIKQEHEVQMVVAPELTETLKSTEKYLNFIKNTIHNKWNLTVWVTSFDSEGKTIYDFGFENRKEAVMFKLACS